MKKWIFAVALMLIALTSGAQNYKWAVGARANWAEAGLNARYFHDKLNSWQFAIDVHYSNTAWHAMAFKEWNYFIPANESFNLFGGVGLMYGSFADYEITIITIGASLILGAEYDFPKIPLGLSIDYRPRVFYNTHKVGFASEFADVAIGVKWTF